MHWHVGNGSGDPSESFEDMWSALAYAEDELRSIAEYHFEGISASGDAGCYEVAYDEFKFWQLYDNLYANAKNLGEQHCEPDYSKRYPLYQGEDSDSKLEESAIWLIDKINNESSVEICSCFEYECAPEQETE